MSKFPCRALTIQPEFYLFAYVLKCIEDRNKHPPTMAPSAVLSGRRKPTKSKKQQGAQKRKRDDVDVEKLEQAVENLVCLRFSQFLGSDSESYASPILSRYISKEHR